VRRRRVQLAVAVAVFGVMGVVAAAVAGGHGQGDIREHLTGYEETPATLSTTGVGDFRARVRDSRIEYKLSYSGLEGDVTQAHIHLGGRSLTGGISVFLCKTTQTAPEGTPTCPPSPATVTGTIEPSDVIGPTAQGIDPGEYNELLRAIRAGATYANVHSTKYPTGEIRAQLERGHDDW